MLIEEFEALRWFDKHRAEFIQDICELINFKSISDYNQNSKYPFGKECAKALDFMLDKAKKIGLETYNHDYYCASALLKGKTEKEIGIYVHLDVVPAGDNWKFKPFSGEYWNGFVVGRGSADNKGSAICALYLLWFFIENKIVFDNSIRLFFGCDEESGMRDIAYFLSKNNEPEFNIVMDAPFGVSYGELGAVSCVVKRNFNCEKVKLLKSGDSSSIIPNYAEVELINCNDDLIENLMAKDLNVKKNNDTIIVSANGISSHAAQPEKSINACAKLCKELLNINYFENDDEMLLKLIANTFNVYNGESINCEFEDELSGKLTHAGGYVKCIDNIIEFSINIRYPIHLEYNKLYNNLKSYFDANNLEIVKLRHSEACYISPDDPIVDMLFNICEETLCQKQSKYILRGGTYARKLKKAVSYGPGVRPRYSPFGNSIGMGHQPDECVEINVLRNAFKVYTKAFVLLDNMLKEDNL